MAGPGQSETTTLAVLAGIRDHLIEMTPLTTGLVFIAAEPVFLGTAYPGDEYVQIVPGVGVDNYSGVGLGVIDDQFRIAIYSRLLVDRAFDDAERLTSKSVGILKLVDKIDAALTQNFLSGLLLQPLIPLRREPGTRVTVASSGWAQIDRLFSCRYRVAFADPQKLNA